MQTINIDNLIADLTESQIEFARSKHPNFTIEEGAVIAAVLDIVAEAIKDASTHAHITLEEIPNG